MRSDFCRIRSKKLLGSDQGWTYAETIVSMVMLTIIFLGFTVTLLAFREWINRSWAIRVMDQYANDVMSDIEANLRRASRITQNPAQYGLGSFTVEVDSILNYYPALFLQTRRYTYSARPNFGIYKAIDNTAPQKIDPDFPPEDWENSHRFVFTEFSYPGPYVVPNTANNYFSDGMVRVYMSIRYERPRKEETSMGIQNRKYTLFKRYSVSIYMKNFVDGPAQAMQ